MMILSRIWYVILALLLAAAYYVVSLAVGQYNRRNHAAMEEILKTDSQAVGWAMQVDARGRLDRLYLAASDPGVAKALRSAFGKDPVPPASREEATKVLRGFNDKLPVEYKNDALFVADRDGRVISQIGYDAANAFPEFELGGYPAVFDALHGFLRDDTWVWGGRVARVVARPIEDEVGQPPLGAIVGLRWIDNAFAKDIGNRTGANIAFFALGQEVAHVAITDGFEDKSFEILRADLKEVSKDKGFREEGHVRPLDGSVKGGVLYAGLPGDAWELGAGFAVVLPKVSIPSAMGFLRGADDRDKGNVNWWIAALIFVGGSAIGILLSLLEHSKPMKEMARQAARLKKGEIDVLALPQFRAGFRSIAADINDGIHRVVEKGGGVAGKPADLESILGPASAKPSMSAFAFPDRSTAQPAPTFPSPLPSPLGPSAPTPPLPIHAPINAPNTNANEANASEPNTASANEPTARPPTAPAPPPLPGSRKEERASGAQLPADRGVVANAANVTSRDSAPADLAGEWQSVYDEFLRTKRECNESTDGLTFEKFSQTLTKNRDALIKRHGCKRVKFTVYVKQGRASLKATPVRE
ncbi:MAG: hypothetical protein FWD73_10865 [Polyangiaceae bacterium]|nr:hypothetical protein [Polyangiaceae bacterium]